jgi:DNA sulfur modification protein DndD
MRLFNLLLKNFRQFHGEHKLEFNSDQNKSITVIHGENGSGKTSLLNAFKWGFYGVTNFDTGVENILNEQAIAMSSLGDDIELKVAIEFEHEDRQYTLVRSQTFKKADGMAVESIGSSVLKLTWIGSNGKFETSPNPNNQINQILPEKMHSYFFFDGERIEKLANASASNQISTAIKTLMGLEIVERAREHLKGAVTKKLRQSMRGSSDASLDELNDQQDELSDKIEEDEKELVDVQNNKTEFEVEIEGISQRLSSIKEAVKLQEERENIEERIEGIKSELQECKSEMASTFSEKGFLAFFDGAASSVSKELESRRKKGELPYRIKPQFIEDLIELKECICGQPLHHGNDAYNAVIKYKKNSGDSGIEEAFNETTGSLKQIPFERRELFDGLRRLSARKSKLWDERKQLNGRLEEISENLFGETEDISNLEERRRYCEKEKGVATGQEAVIGDQLKRLAERQKALRLEIDKQSSLNEEAAHINRKIQIADECSRVLSELYGALAQQTRTQLSEKVDRTFQNIIRKPYWAEIDHDYRLQIYKEIPGHGRQLVLEKSTGEKQITSLSFIASIVSLAKEKSEADGQFFRGGIFPIVMDSPFGSLDDEYRGLVAGSIPNLADQIILFATTSQWKGEVEKACQAYVGKEISLIYHTPDLEEGEGSHYKRLCKDHEFTTIEDGYHG